MSNDIRRQVLHRRMSRKEFLQFTGGSLFIFFGFGNLLPLLNQVSKTTGTSKSTTATTTSNTFGSRKFGV